MINALYDPWEDLLRTIKRGIASRVTYVKDFTGSVDSNTTTVNIKSDDAFTPEEKNISIIDVKDVYNEDIDSDHDTSILSSFNSSSISSVVTPSSSNVDGVGA